MSSGGTASSTTVSGGTETVSSGGILHDATISGGAVEIKSGGTAGSSTITISSGTLKLDNSQHFGGNDLGPRRDGNAGGRPRRHQLRHAADAGLLGNSGTSGTLTVSDGTHVATLAMIGIYTALSFHATADAGTGTQITDPPVSQRRGPLRDPPH